MLSDFVYLISNEYKSMFLKKLVIYRNNPAPLDSLHLMDCFHQHIAALPPGAKIHRSKLEECIDGFVKCINMQLVRSFDPCGINAATAGIAPLTQAILKLTKSAGNNKGNAASSILDIPNCTARTDPFVTFSVLNASGYIDVFKLGCSFLNQKFEAFLLPNKNGLLFEIISYEDSIFNDEENGIFFGRTILNVPKKIIRFNLNLISIFVHDIDLVDMCESLCTNYFLDEKTDLSIAIRDLVNPYLDLYVHSGDVKHTAPLLYSLNFIYKTKIKTMHDHTSFDDINIKEINLLSYIEKVVTLPDMSQKLYLNISLMRLNKILISDITNMLETYLKKKSPIINVFDLNRNNKNFTYETDIYGDIQCIIVNEKGLSDHITNLISSALANETRDYTDDLVPSNSSLYESSRVYFATLRMKNSKEKKPNNVGDINLILSNKRVNPKTAQTNMYMKNVNIHGHPVVSLALEQEWCKGGNMSLADSSTLILAITNGGVNISPLKPSNQFVTATFTGVIKGIKQLSQSKKILKISDIFTTGVLGLKPHELGIAAVKCIPNTKAGKRIINLLSADKHTSILLRNDIDAVKMENTEFLSDRLPRLSTIKGLEGTILNYLRQDVNHGYFSE